MDGNRIEGTVDQAKGSLKNAVGKVTGDTELQAEDTAETIAGKVKSRVGKARDPIRDAFK